MHTMSRRRFLGGSAMGIALSAGAGRLMADPLGMPIGFQVYPVREALIKDFEGTLKEVASLGYRSVEMCSPPGYNFGSLVNMKAGEMRKIINGTGLRCDSCHYGWKELKENLDERIAFAKGLGLKQMVLSSFGLRQDAAMSEWVRAAEELNKIGETTRKAGLQLGFHNHHFEFRQIDGVLIYDQLMNTFDPKLVKMQFQVAVINLGYEAATYMTKYPGRFISLHLADWSAQEKKPAPVGSGSVDWKKLFTAAKTGGVKNYYVEMNLDAMKTSVQYLKDLKV